MPTLRGRAELNCIENEAVRYLQRTPTNNRSSPVYHHNSNNQLQRRQIQQQQQQQYDLTIPDGISADLSHYSQLSSSPLSSSPSSSSSPPLPTLYTPDSSPSSEAQLVTQRERRRELFVTPTKEKKRKMPEQIQIEGMHRMMTL